MENVRNGREERMGVNKKWRIGRIGGMGEQRESEEQLTNGMKKGSPS